MGMSDLCLKELEGWAAALLKLPLTSSVWVCQSAIQPPVENFSGLSHASLPKPRNFQHSTALPVAIYTTWCRQTGFWAGNQNGLWCWFQAGGDLQEMRGGAFLPRHTDLLLDPGPALQGLVV